ncbi:complex I NDUFA9 subunit family protein [Radicibacter daui]|uniref:complex I NDUFA9 subunit family protein n=1 Tax=Radicibacter daui TaxID=3064829 RepID=UPI004046EBB4
MTPRIVTIFGGTGFIGHYLVAHLAATGAQIRVVTRAPQRVLTLKPNGFVAQIVAATCDYRDDASVAAVVAGSDTVVNLIGILAEGHGQSFDTVHHRLPERIARAAAAAGVRTLVHISAIGASAESPSSYARSKAAGEAAVRAAFPPAVILRPSVIFGPEDGFFNRFARLSQFLPALPLIGGGTTRMQPVYVGDVVGAIMRAVTDPALAGSTAELGGPMVYSFRELMALTLRLANRRRRLVVIPWGLAMLQAGFLECLPGAPMLTRDQVRLLKQDNVVSAGAMTLADLGISPTAAEIIVPTYLDKYRSGGRFVAPSRG